MSDYDDHVSKGLLNLDLTPDPANDRIWASYFLGAADTETFANRWRILFAHGLVLGLYIFFVVAMAGAVAAVVSVPPETYAQSFFVEVASGLVMFPIGAVVVAIGRRWRLPVYAAILVAAGAAGLAGANTAGILHAFLLEACVGLLLVLGVDLIFKSIEASARQAIVRAQERQAEHERLQAEAEELASPQYYAFGGGTIEETLIFNQVARHASICDILRSDAPCEDTDMLAVVASVNRLKTTNRDEYFRAKAWAAAPQPKPRDPPGPGDGGS